MKSFKILHFFYKKLFQNRKNRIATLTSAENKEKMSKIDWKEVYKNMKIYRVCISKHLEFLQITSPELLKKILTYKKKNNGCYCYPESCYGHILIKILNQMVSYTNIYYVNKYFNSKNILILKIPRFWIITMQRYQMEINKKLE